MGGVDLMPDGSVSLCRRESELDNDTRPSYRPIVVPGNSVVWNGVVLK